jgi:hypothetical protein
MEGNAMPEFLKKYALASVMLFMALATPVAKAAYVLTPLKSGTSDSSVSVAPGGTFAVDFVLSSNASDVHNSIIFRPIFSAPDLVLQTYNWTGGYTNATGPGQLDDSTPNVVDQLDGRAVTPTSISATTFSGPAGVVDVEMSNAQFGTFAVGNVVTLTFLVPAGWSGPNTVTIDVVPDTIQNGIGGPSIVTTSGGPLTVNIIPEPASLGFVGVAAVGLLAARRRRA